MVASSCLTPAILRSFVQVEASVALKHKSCTTARGVQKYMADEAVVKFGVKESRELVRSPSAVLRLNNKYARHGCPRSQHQLDLLSPLRSLCAMTQLHFRHVYW